MPDTVVARLEGNEVPAERTRSSQGGVARQLDRTDRLSPPAGPHHFAAASSRLRLTVSHALMFPPLMPL